MLYTKELVQPKAQPPLGLQRFKPHPRRDACTKYKSELSRSCECSSVHGMQYVCEQGQYWLEGCFWLLIVVSASAFFWVMYSVLATRHNAQNLITIVETTQLPVYNIEFPAVAICMWNHVNWLRTKTAAERYLPRHADAHVRNHFQDLVLGMEKLTFGNFENLESLVALNLSGLSELSITDLALYLSFRCDEIFVPNSCMFDETEYDCCKLFVMERTEEGQCMVFNSLITDDSRKKKIISDYPFRLSTAGEGSGLKFSVHLNHSLTRSGTDLPFVMNLMIKDPRQWNNPNTFQMYENTENFVSIRPVVIETLESTLRLKPTNRGCYFPSETADNDLIYSRDNCISICHHQSVMDNCHCILPLFFPLTHHTDGMRECGVMDLKCLYEYADVFSYLKMRDQEKYINDTRRGQTCICYNTCLVRSYQLNRNVRLLTYNMNATNKLIKADIYYAQRVMTKYSTKLEYTYVDLLANFGGILGLCVGASALSFAEGFYTGAKLLWMLLRDSYAIIRRSAIKPTVK